MSRTLSNSKRDRGLSLETLQPKWASSSVQGRISWFALSCGRNLRVLLELRVDLGHLLVSPQGCHISFVIVRGTSGFFTHHCRDEYGLISS